VNSGPENPVEAVIDVPEIVDAANAPPVNAGAEKPVLADIEAPEMVELTVRGPEKILIPEPEILAEPVVIISPNTVTVGIPAVKRLQHFKY
jgi:hypothetical protein